MKQASVDFHPVDEFSVHYDVLRAFSALDARWLEGFPGRDKFVDLHRVLVRHLSSGEQVQMLLGRLPDTSSWHVWYASGHAHPLLHSGQRAAIRAAMRDAWRHA